MALPRACALLSCVGVLSICMAQDDVTIGENDRVWGVCYEIDPAHAVEVRAYLDHREKDGYSVSSTDVWHGNEVVIPHVRSRCSHLTMP